MSPAHDIITGFQPVVRGPLAVGVRGVVAGCFPPREQAEEIV